MLIIMSDTYRHCGTYPRYTIAVTKNYSSFDNPEVPVIIRQYSANDVIVDVYDTIEDAYGTYRLFVSEEQPFIPALDRNKGD